MTTKNNHIISDPLILQSKIFEPHAHRMQAGLSLRLLGSMSFQREPLTTILDRRQEFFQRMHIDIENVVGMELAHGKNIARVTHKDRGLGAASPKDAFPKTDALVTNDANVWLLSTHADCAPVFVFDPVKSAVGIAHAGWKGLLFGIVGKTITRFAEYFQSDPADLLVWVGPTIGPCCYQVGKDIADAFRTLYSGENVVIISKGKPNLNLWRIVELELLHAGVPSQSIELPTECTACHSRYGSYRRDKKQTVYMGAVIGLLPEK